MIPKFKKKRIMIVALGSKAKSITEQMIDEIKNPIEYFGGVPTENIPIFKDGERDLMPNFYEHDVGPYLWGRELAMANIKNVCDTFIENEVRVLILFAFIGGNITTGASRIISNIAKVLGVYTIPVLVHPLYNYSSLDGWYENIDTRASLLVEFISDDLLYYDTFGPGALPIETKRWAVDSSIPLVIRRLVKAIPSIEQEDIDTEHIIEEMLKIKDRLLKLRREGCNHISNHKYMQGK